MAKEDIPPLLDALVGAGGDLAWADFLQEYSGILQQVIEQSCLSGDDRGDCFIFICEQLVAERFRRLRRFKANGTASFPTWLRAVSRNLCIDWRRKQHGRPQPLELTKRLSSEDQHIYLEFFTRGFSVEETLQVLQPAFPALSLAAVEEAVQRLAATLSPRQRWLLSLRYITAEPLERNDCEGRLDAVSRIADPSPDPESVAISRESERLLEQAMQRLTIEEQILVRM